MAAELPHLFAPSPAGFQSCRSATTVWLLWNSKATSPYPTRSVRSCGHFGTSLRAVVVSLSVDVGWKILIVQKSG